MFSGIRGFDLAAEKAGWKNVASVEIDESLNRRFKKIYPHAIQHTDIRTTDFTPYRGIVDVVSGGFPCQPYSSAGQRKGTEDERHLWPEMLRGVREIQPQWVVGENVRGIVSWSKGLVFEQMCADLENEGYEVQPFVLPAASINAPHERYRCWFVAHCVGERHTGNGQPVKQPGEIESTGLQSESAGFFESTFTNTSSGGRLRNGRQKRIDGKEKTRKGVFGQPERLGKKQPIANANSERYEQFGASDLAARSELYSGRTFDCWDNWTTEPPVCGVDDGLPVGMDVARLRSDLRRLYPAATEKYIERAIQKTTTAYRNEMIKGYGNAVVWQIPYRIFSAINEYEKMSSGLK